MKKLKAAGWVLAVVVPLLISAPADAKVKAHASWSGAKVVSISCPEVHFYLPDEGLWGWKRYSDNKLVDSGKVHGGGNVVVGGNWAEDNDEHVWVVAVGNAANMNDGKVTSAPWRVSRCAPPVTTTITGPPGPQGPPGPAGPTGPAGTPGAGFGCNGMLVDATHPPALCPGTTGPTGLTRKVVPQVIHRIIKKKCIIKKPKPHRPKPQPVLPRFPG